MTAPSLIARRYVVSVPALLRPLTAVTEAAANALSVRRVFGDPITAGSTTLVPVATVIGGHGVAFGTGSRAAGEDAPEALAERDAAVDATAQSSGAEDAAGGGGGFGVLGWAAGAYVVTEEGTTWRPAVDPNLVIVGAAALASCVVTAVASVAAIRVIAGVTGRIAGATAASFSEVAASAAQSFGALASSASDSVRAVATSSGTAFSSAAGSAAGALGTASTRATEAFVAGAGAAQATALGLGELGAKALTGTVDTASRTVETALKR